MSDTMTTNQQHEEESIQTPPKAGTQEQSVPSTPGPATRIRQKITPYLPPPVVAAMQQIDPQLEPVLGPEASITLMGTLVVALLVWRLLSLVMGRSSTTSGGAIQDEQEDDAIVEYDDVSYDGTVLLCGPPLAGKTSIFYTLVHPTSPSFQTVSSIKPNTGFVTKDNRVWRYLDTPGHWSPQKLVATVLTGSNSSIDRIVLVLDSTQPVSKSVDFLYGLLQHFQSTTSKSKKPSVLVACHKSKSPKAKNVRRLKLQVRNELERLGKLMMAAENAAASTVNWDDVLSSQVGFISTSVDPPMLDHLKAYLESGTLPEST